MSHIIHQAHLFIHLSFICTLIFLILVCYCCGSISHLHSNTLCTGLFWHWLVRCFVPSVAIRSSLLILVISEVTHNYLADSLPWLINAFVTFETLHYRWTLEISETWQTSFSSNCDYYYGIIWLKIKRTAFILHINLLLHLYWNSLL